MVEVGRGHELLGTRNDAVHGPRVLLVPLEIENVADLVARAEENVNVGLGVRRRQTEAHTRGDERCGTEWVS